MKHNRVVAAIMPVDRQQAELWGAPRGTVKGVNRAGFVIHSAVHMAGHDLICVLHSHTIAGAAVSCQKDRLLPRNQHALGVIGDVAYHSYEGAATRLDERERILADLGDRRILVLRNHGLLTVGRSIGEAFVRDLQDGIGLRDAARLPAIGRRVLPDPRGGRARRLLSRERPVRQRRPQDPATFEWPALLRKLDRIDPSYKQ